ncbi:hypothetical protein GCM10009789_16300 [Kribbella sancticallisti]|uniref:Uncharacterized protein n=1 Tax=Kribbella sancticallisti TaxID=460087 RepID=A0ABP4NPV2_9ACTN
MNWTDYAGLIGLLAAAAVAAWMLLGAGTISPHRGQRRHAAPIPSRPARHRAPSPLPGRLRAR